MNHRRNASYLRAIAAGLRLRADEWAMGAALELDRVADDLPKHTLALVPDVYHPTPVQMYLLVHIDADGNWQSLSLHADKAEAAKEKAKMRRHWNRLRAKGIDV